MGTPDRPTRVRYGVFALLGGLTFVLYLDRTCIGQAIPFMQRELLLSNQEMSHVAAAFTIAYGLFEVVTGHWGDRFGSRAVLTRIVLWWSAFTALTGAATGYVNLLVVRFLFGVGEAGALPNAARITETWFPVEIRGMVRGVVNMPMMLGAVVAPPLSAYLIEGLGWRWLFLLYGLVGVVWAALFWWWFRDRPAEHPRVNDAEKELIGAPPLRPEHPAIPWGPLFSSGNVWLLGAVISAGACTVYTLFTWYPKYLVDIRGVENRLAGWLSAMVMLGGAIGCLVGGWVADLANRHFRGTRWTRSSVGACGFALAAFGMVAGSLSETELATSAWFALACFGIHTHAGAYWGVAADIGGQHVAALFAVINSLGVVGAAGGQLALGYIPQEYWQQAFGGCGALLGIGALCWACVDARRKAVSADDSGR